MLTGNLFFLQPNLAHSSGFYRQFSTKDLPSRQTGSELGNAIFFHQSFLKFVLVILRNTKGGNPGTFLSGMFLEKFDL